MLDFIKASAYSDTVKTHLYEFFFDPIPYIQKLQFELMTQSVKLTAYYEKHHRIILDTFADLSYEKFTEQLDGFWDVTCLDAVDQTIYLSCCLINKILIKINNLENGAIAFLGYDYVSSIKQLKSSNTRPSANSLGIVLQEESRVKMLDLLLERGEMTCKDMEKAFNFSGSTAYHHLTIMLRHGAIKGRNQGKTVLYSINKSFFDNARIVISQYSSKKER